MVHNRHRRLHWPLLLLIMLVVAFLLSTVLYFILRPELHGRIFFYPLNSVDTIGSERRAIPERAETTGQIEIFIQELFIGPVTLALASMIPQGTQLRHVAVIDQTAYLDLNLKILNTDAELPISFNDALENIRYNLLFNFPRMKDVIFTIEGKQVGTMYDFGRNDKKMKKHP